MARDPDPYRKSPRNPSGRHRGSGSGARASTVRDGEPALTDDADRLLLRILAETRVVPTSDGSAVEMTLREALLRKALETALKGSPVAQRDLLDRDARATAAEAARIARECDDWTVFRDRQKARHTKARAAGLPVTDILPHPDDIEIVHGRGVRFLGPFTTEERDRWRGALALREALFLQDALEYALNGRKDVPPAAGTPLCFAILLDESLPPSLRLGRISTVQLSLRLQSRAKRDLLRDTHRAWKTAGVPLPRGTRFTTPALLWEFFDVLVTGVRDINTARSPAERDAIAEDVAADLKECHGEAAVTGSERIAP